MKRNDYRRWCGVQKQESAESKRCKSPPDQHCTEFKKSLSRLKHMDRKLRSLECGFKDIQRRHSSLSPDNASLATKCDYAPYQSNNNNRLSTACAPNVAYGPTSARRNVYEKWNNSEGASCKDSYSVGGEVPKGNRQRILRNNQSKSLALEF